MGRMEGETMSVDNSRQMKRVTHREKDVERLPFEECDPEYPDVPRHVRLCYWIGSPTKPSRHAEAKYEDSDE